VGGHVSSDGLALPVSTVSCRRMDENWPESSKGRCASTRRRERLVSNMTSPGDETQP
jgi:hypothetical protein